MAIRISSNSLALTRQLKALPERQLPFVRALIATRLAQAVAANERATMMARIDRPTRWTMNSLFVQAGTKQKPEARVAFKDRASNGTPAGQYLQPQVFGGDRKQKRSERALIHMGKMGPRQYVRPGAGAKLDRHGNITKAGMSRILGHVKTQGAIPASGMQRTSRGGDFFFAEIDGNKGVWQRVRSGFGDGVRPVLMQMDRAPRYRKRFAFFEVAQNTVRARYARVSTAVIDEVLRSARP
jgi:hypothetical protein